MSEGVGPVELVQQYLSREHRDSRATGCTVAALGNRGVRSPYPPHAPALPQEIQRRGSHVINRCGCTPCLTP